MAETKVQKILDGATVPEVSDDFEKIVFVSLLIPTGDPNAGCKMGIPTIFWGLSGIGKSRRIESASARLGLPLRTVFPATKQPEDFSDLPVVLKDNLVSACLLTQVNELNRAQGGVLFVDEASLAVPAVQGAMLSMVLDRVVGSTAIHPNVRILLAANPPKYAAGGWGLEAPFANRMFHFFVDRPSREALVRWLMQEGSTRTTDMSDAMDKLKANWGREWAKAKGVYSGFVMKGTTEALFNQPEPNHAQAGYCWPSPRTWEMGIRAYATIRTIGESDKLVHQFLEAAVGVGPATEFLKYMAEADLPDPKSVLDDGWKIDTKRLDKTTAVTTSVLSYVTGIKQIAEKHKYAEAAWKFLKQLADVHMTDAVLTGSEILVQDGLGPATKGIPDFVKKAAEPVILALAPSPVMTHVK